MSHSEAVWHQIKQTQNSLYQQLLLVAPWFTRSRHSRKLYKYLIWQVFTPDAHPDATPKRCASPPGIKHGIFCLLSKCVNYYTMEPRVHLTRHEMLCYCQLESLTSPFKAHSAVPFSVATADAHNVYIFYCLNSTNELFMTIQTIKTNCYFCNVSCLCKHLSHTTCLWLMLILSINGNQKCHLGLFIKSFYAKFICPVTMIHVKDVNINDAKIVKCWAGSCLKFAVWLMINPMFCWHFLLFSLCCSFSCLCWENKETSLNDHVQRQIWCCNVMAAID